MYKITIKMLGHRSYAFCPIVAKGVILLDFPTLFLHNCEVD